MSPHQKQTSFRKGVTIIELTVIIAVILLLVSTLVLGGKYYMNSSHRSACITNINGIHKAIRSAQNIEHLPTGASITMGDIVGAGKALPKMPQCPQSSGSYILADKVAPVGTVMVFCQEYDPAVGSVDSSLDHSPGVTTTW